MIDLSITQDPEWIKRREAVWTELEDDFKEGMRKKELQQLKNYFFTGVYDGENFPCLAYILWFPIKTREALDFVLKNLVKKADVYEEAFYCFISDLSGYFFTNEEELALWDYFAGSEFKPVVTSRVPVGKEKKIVSFEVDKNKIGSILGGKINSWLRGSYSDIPKWILRSDYFFSYVKSLENESFLPDRKGQPIGNGAYFTKILINYIFNGFPENGLKGVSLNLRIEFLQRFKHYFESITMPPAMKILWEETKHEKGSK